MTVFEVQDISNDEEYLSLGIFSSFEKAKAVVLHYPDPNSISPRDYDEYAEFAIVRRTLNTLDNGGICEAIFKFNKNNNDNWELTE